MIWQQFIENVALGFGGISLSTTGILVALLLTILIDIAVLMLTTRSRGNTQGMALMFVDLAVTILFTVLQWYPLFVGTVIAFVFALLGASIIQERLVW